MLSKLWRKIKEITSKSSYNNAEIINPPVTETESLDLSALRALIQTEISKTENVQSSTNKPASEETMESLIGAEHYNYLIASITTSKEKLVIMSGWLSEYVIDSVFLKLISSRLKEGVSIYIGYGYQDHQGQHNEFGKSKEVLNSLKELIKKYPDQLFVASYATHEKLLLVDERLAVRGSANWLSNRLYKNSESSVIITNNAYVKSEAARAISLVMENRIEVEIPKPKPLVKVSSNENELSEQDEKLLAHLKVRRAILAKKEAIAAFQVFHDKVLKEMACRRPNTREQMLAVRGVGKVKFHSYGHDFMAVIAEHHE